MTKSTITRERIEQYANDPRMCNINDEIRQMARMALAAMDSEPDCNERQLFCSTDTARMKKVISVYAGSEATPLYRHAQPAPEKYNIGDATMRHIFTPTGMTNVSDMQAVFDRVEAVLVGMDQPAPVVPKEITAGIAVKYWEGGRGSIESFVAGYNFCRAAMLAAAQQEVKGE